MARPQGPRHRRQHARDRRQDRTRDPLLSDIVVTARRPPGTDGARPLGDRERPALGHGYDLPRRRVPHPNRQRPENVVTLKHMAVNLARKAKGRDSVRLALKTAAWDDDYLAKLIAA